MSASKLRRSIQRHLIAGLIVIAPLSVTVWVLLWIFQWLDGLIGRFIYPAIGSAIGRETLVIPGLGMLVLFLLLLTTGWLAERAIGSRVLIWWNDLLDRTPVVRRIYGAANRIVRTVFGDEAKPFNSVIMCEWPSAGRWSIGFLSAESPHAVRDQLGDMVTVFIPTTPNPTTGFMVMLRRDQVLPIAMSVDEAFTLILSAGAVRPDLADPETVTLAEPIRDRA